MLTATMLLLAMATSIDARSYINPHCSQRIPGKAAVPTAGASWVNVAWTDGNGFETVTPNHQVVLVDPLDPLKENVTEFMADIHRNGQYALCYLNVGSWENWRADSAAWPQDLLSKQMEHWPNESWWDITKWNDPRLLSAHQARMSTMWEMGCDGLEMDNVDCALNECVDGYTTEQLQPYNIDYVNWLAAEAHNQCMDASLKNAHYLFPYVAEAFQMSVNEQCQEYQEWGECDHFVKYFSSQNKPVFAVEYTNDYITAGCAYAIQNKFSRKYYDMQENYRDCEAEY